MIKNYEMVERLQFEYDREHPLTVQQKYHILNSLHREAKQFGHFTVETAAEGIEHDIAIAKILNAHVRDTSRQNSTGA